MAGTFTDNEKIIYSLKYALNLTTKDPTAAAGFEFLSAPRIFPSSIASVDLIKVGEGDIDSSGNDSTGNLVDLTSPYDTVKLYRIIDPITNKVSNKTVNDVLGTSVAALAATYSSAETTQPTTSSFQTGKVYRYWFHDYSSGSYDGNSEPPFDWKGIRLAFNKATAGEVVTEDSDLFVNHISLYLGVPLKPIAGSSWSTGTGDSISYEHDKTKGRYLLNLLGLSNKFVTRINKNDFSNIKTDTASANEGDTWFTNPTYGLLSFYGIKDSLASDNSGIGVVAGTNTPRLSFCRYIGETAATTGLGGGSNQNSETSNQNSGGSGQGSVTIERSLGSVPNSEVVLSEKKTLFGKNLIITDNMDLYDYYINSINSYNLTTRAFANQVKLIDCGKRHTICVLNTGTVITCGEPGDGQLGRLVDSYNKESYIFDQILKRDGYDGTNAVSVSAGDYHSLILLNNGKVLSFGKNDGGQLGIYKGYTPSEQQIGTSFTHLPTAVKFDNSSGNLIIGGSEFSSSYMGTNSYDGTNAIAIATGAQHSLILLKSGKVLGFGWSNKYQTGSQYSNNDGTPYDYIDHPIDFPENGDYDGTNAVMMAGGYEHSLILLKTGKVMAIGNNDFGQLGNPPATFNTTTLIDVNSLSGMAYDGTNAISITASHRQSGILLNNGKVEFCGENNTGSFGNDNKNRQYYLTEPTISDNLDYGTYTGNNIIDVKLGSYSGMMLTNNGSVLTSGANYAGQRGHDIEHSKGTTGGNIYETKFIEINNFTTIEETGNLSYMSNAIAIANHTEFKMVILKTGVIIGFGTNYYGQLGSSTSYISNSTNNILIPLNADHTNSVIYDGTNAFYKNNKENIILDISDNEQINDHKNFNIDKSKIISINNNLNFKSNDNLYDDYFKSLYSLVLSERFFANNISLATITSYAGLFVTNDGKVISFGANKLDSSDAGDYHKGVYKLGRSVFPVSNGNGRKSNIPIEIDRTKDYDGTNAISVCSGAYHVAILLNNGKVLTYGVNRYGQLGNRDAPTSAEGGDVNWNDGNKMYRYPEEIVDPSGIYDGTNASSISCGQYHTAVLLNNGKVLTFGRNNYGELGDGNVGVNNNYLVNNTPREIVDPSGHYDGTNAVKVVCGAQNTAVLLNNGKVLTCGGGYLYMRGDGRTDRVSVGTFGEMNYNSGYDGYNAIDIEMGASTTYVILNSGKAIACGWNRYKSNGNTSYDNQVELMEINSNGPYNKTNARKIFASSTSKTFFMLTSDGKISSAGRNLTGGGGSGSDTPVETAVLKEIPLKNGYNGKNIAYIATGAPAISETENYSLAILNSGKVLTCGGYNNNGELGSNRYYTPYTTASFSRNTTNVVYYFDEIIKTNYYDGTNGFFKKSGNLTFEKDSGIRIEDNRMVLYGDDISVDGNIDFIKGIQFRGNSSGFKKRFLYLTGSSGVYYFYIGKILHGFKGSNTDIFTNVKLYRAGTIGSTNGTDQQTYLEATFTARRGAFRYRWKMENASSSRDNIVVTTSDAPIYGKGETNSQSWNYYMSGAVDHRKTHHLFIKTRSYGAVAVEIIFDRSDAEIFDEPIRMASGFNPENSDSKLFGNTVFSTENTSTYPPNWKTELGDIVSNGNVGIGTNDPYYGLSINTNRAGASHNCPIGVHLGMEQTDKYAVIELRSTLSSEINFGPGSELSKGRIKYDNSTNSFVFYTNGSNNERMRIDGNGNVGIGNTSPKNKLDITTNYTGDYTSAININSSFRDRNIYSIGFNNNNGQGEYQCGMGAIPGNRGFFSTSSSYVLGTHILSTAEWGIYSSGWDKLFGIDGGSGNAYIKGNVGIGTNDPKSALHVVGPSLGRDNLAAVKGIHMGEYGTNDYAIEICAAGTSNSSYIDFTTPGVNYRGRIIYRHSGNSNSSLRDAFTFYTAGNTSSTPNMIINSSGNVGIGNAGPDCKLHVVTNSTRAAKFKSNYNAGIGGGAYIEVNNNAGTRCILGSDGNGLFNSSTTALILGNWSGGDLKFISTGGGAAGEILTLKSNGNVGIGSSNPNAPLEIKTPANNSFVFDGRGSFSANLIGVGYKFANPNTDNQDTKLLLEQTYTASSSYWSPTGIIMGYWYNTSSGASGSQGAAGGDYAGIGFLVGNGADPYTKKQPAEVCKMYISRGGNVGIGNLFPQRKLCVNAAFNYDGILVNNSSGHLLAKMAQGGSSTIGYFGLYGGVGVDPGAGGSAIVNITSSGNSWFNGGNVGIGTTSPDAKLRVSGSVNISGTTKIWSEYLRLYGSDPTFWAGQSDNHGGGMRYEAGNDWIEFIRGDYSQHVVFKYRYNSNNVIFNGRVGIGTSSPGYPLHVNGYVSTSSSFYFLSEGQLENYYSHKIFKRGYDGNGGSFTARFHNGIYVDFLGFTSDERIKKNIIEINDSSALEKVRNIGCYWYNYKNYVEKGFTRTAGFIAQQVNEYVPEAITLVKSIIPNEYRLLNNYIWLELLYDSSDNIVENKIYDESGNDITKYKYKLTINDLSDNSGNTLYKFEVFNDLSSNACEKEIRSLENEPNSFIFEEKWNNVFLFGKEVDDFHTLDKNKLYALNFSATQEIDRIQQQQIVDISENKFDISENKFKITDSVAKIASLEAQVTSQQEIITTLQNELSSLKQTVQQLIDNAST